MTDWISTKDRLPDCGEYVLTWMPDRPWRARSKTRFAKVQKRRKVSGHECDNNRGYGYEWDEFGPGSAFGWEVTHWAAIEVPE